MCIPVCFPFVMSRTVRLRSDRDRLRAQATGYGGLSPSCRHRRFWRSDVQTVIGTRWGRRAAARRVHLSADAAHGPSWGCSSPADKGTSTRQKGPPEVYWPETILLISYRGSRTAAMHLSSKSLPCSEKRKSRLSKPY